MNINVLGFGIMAKQISAFLLVVGSDVTIWNHRAVDIKQLHKQVKFQAKYLGLSLEKIGNIRIVSSIEELDDTITIEAVSESLDLKRKLYNIIRKQNKKDYFTISSSISPLEIGIDVNVLHFFNPIVSCKIIEFFNNSIRDKQSFDLIKEFENKGFAIIKVLENRGYIANYILFNEIANIFKLIEVYKYPLNEIDKLYNLLFKKDIFKTIDIVGVDVVYAIIKNLKEKDDNIYLPKILQKAIENNVLGKKNMTSLKKYYEENYKG